MPMSFMSARRGSGSKKASTAGSPRRCWGSAAVTPGGRHPGEGGIGDEVADLVLDRHLGAIVDLDVLDDARRTRAE